MTTYPVEVFSGGDNHNRGRNGGLRDENVGSVGMTLFFEFDVVGRMMMRGGGIFRLDDERGYGIVGHDGGWGGDGNNTKRNQM